MKCRRQPWRRIWESDEEQRRQAHHRRRARKRNATVERFSSAEIYERDGWRCGICGKAVDRRLKAPHHMAASLDHIMPLAVGGSHSRSNVQLAHWICNSRKTWVGGGQLKLGLVHDPAF